MINCLVRLKIQITRKENIEKQECKIKKEAKEKWILQLNVCKNFYTEVQKFSARLISILKTPQFSIFTSLKHFSNVEIFFKESFKLLM